MTVTICENLSDGHRQGYVTYFRKQAEDLGQPSRVEPSLWRAMWVAGPLVIPMLERQTFGNLFVIAARPSVRAGQGLRRRCLSIRRYARSRSCSFVEHLLSHVLPYRL